MAADYNSAGSLRHVAPLGDTDVRGSAYRFRCRA